MHVLHMIRDRFKVLAMCCLSRVEQMVVSNCMDDYKEAVVSTVLF